MAGWDRHDVAKFWAGTLTLLLTTPIWLTFLVALNQSGDNRPVSLWLGVLIYFGVPFLVALAVAWLMRFTPEGGGLLILANVLLAGAGLLTLLAMIGSAIS